ncbi:unnamed protein product [Aspergillus oryzae]|nr:unnamed protein product [Aspergillus oryzae]GMF89704.1 unnamed protein product [Aspergillus oryzae]GMG09005.1 unnamed protein product [Aspergillus oryzae]
MSSNRAAYLLEAHKTPLEIQQAPYPTPDPGTIVVRNHAVAINPVDWKLQKFEIFPINVLSGALSQIQSSLNQINKHRRHCKNFTAGDNRYSGFQNFTVLSATLTAPLPPSISYEKAVVLPVSVSTAAAGLFQKDHLNLPHPSLSPQPTGQTILIWGGSSSVGLSAVQLAHAAGVEVITTASQHNHALLKSLGVLKVYDYRSPTVVDDIVAALENKHVVGAYDCISEDKTQRACAEILERSNAARKVLVYTNDVLTPEGLPASVTAKGIFCLTVEDNEVGPAVWVEYLPKALEYGRFKPLPEPLVVGTGLECVQMGIERSMAGLSATKAVVRLV